VPMYTVKFCLKSADLVEGLRGTDTE
jgi:hypothetical protein